jgi:hypothetical protein
MFDRRTRDARTPRRSTWPQLALRLLHPVLTETILQHSIIEQWWDWWHCDASTRVLGGKV